MAVFITILKVTGIVIASLIALVLFLLCLVLFVPIRYRIRGEKGTGDDDIYAKIQVTFLLHIISAGLIYDKDTDIYGKLFGIRIYPRKKKAEDESDKPQAAGEVIPGSDRPAEEAVTDHGSAGNDENVDTQEAYKPEADDITAEGPKPADSHIPEEVPDPGAPHDPDDTVNPRPSTEDDKADTGEAEEDLWDKAEAFIDRIVEKISQKIDQLSDRYDTLKKNAAFWKKAYNDKRNRKAAEHIKEVVIKVLKKAAPKKVRGYAHFGFDDPSTTGSILAVLGILYPVLPRKLVIEPDFEEAVIYGKADIKGRLALYVIGLAFLSLALDKDCRRMWNIYKKHKADT